MLLLESRHKEVKKQHVSAYHWPLSGFILKTYSVRVLYNHCKCTLVLSSHHLSVWLDIAYSIGVKSYYYPHTVYLHRLGGCVVVWCLDSSCGGSITLPNISLLHNGDGKP